MVRARLKLIWNDLGYSVKIYTTVLIYVIGIICTMEIQCHHCGRLFMRYNNWALFCSKECRQGRGETTCSRCGKVFPKVSKNQLFCSRICREGPKERDYRDAYCKRCGKVFKKSHPNHLFCSKKCREKIDRPPMADTERCLTTGSIGAIHELLVSVDLTRLGWHIFRAISPCCPCDLVAMKGEKLLRIQVTKAKRNHDGKLVFNPHQGEPHDVLALSTIQGEIVYVPDTPRSYNA